MTTTVSFECIASDQLSTVAGGLSIPGLHLKPIDWGRVGKDAAVGAGEGALKGAIKGAIGGSFVGPEGTLGGAAGGALVGGAKGGLFGAGKSILKQELGH
jgi:hypothetical protein